jgi:C_GCAxxG_C_C family probable redox protein
MTDINPENKQELMEKAYALAYENEQKYGCCPQCVLAAIQDTIGIGDDATFKASHALAGGGALSGGGTCGALVGGMLILGAKYGRDREHFASPRFMQSFKLGKKLYDRFVEEFGSPICSEVHARLFGQSYDLWNKEQYQAFEAAGGHLDKCPMVAGKVSAWAVEILLENEVKTY